MLSSLNFLKRQMRHHQHIKDSMKKVDAGLAKEAKAIVALAFRNGPIEDIHAGRVCPVCCVLPGYSRITDDEMKAMMKFAVNAVYKILWSRDHDPGAYRRSIDYGVCFASPWDEPERSEEPVPCGQAPRRN